MTEVASVHVAIAGDDAGAIAALRKLQKELKGTSQAAGKNTSAFSKLRGMAIKLAAGFAVMKLAKAAVDFGMVAARARVLGVVLKTVGTNAGYTESQLETYVSRVKDLGIETKAAHDIIIQMISAKLKLADATKFARMAQDAAVIGDTNSSVAARDMVQALTSLQPRMLKKYNLIVNLNTAYAKYAKSIGVAVEELTVQQQREAMGQEMMVQGASISGAYANSIDETAKKVGSLARHQEEARRIVGEGMVPAIGAAVDGFTNMLKVVADNEEAVQALVGSLGDAGAGFIAFASNVMTGAEKHILAYTKIQIAHENVRRELAGKPIISEAEATDILNRIMGWSEAYDKSADAALEAADESLLYSGILSDLARDAPLAHAQIAAGVDRATEAETRWVNVAGRRVRVWETTNRLEGTAINLTKALVTSEVGLTAAGIQLERAIVKRARATGIATSASASSASAINTETAAINAAIAAEGRWAAVKARGAAIEAERDVRTRSYHKQELRRLQNRREALEGKIAGAQAGGGGPSAASQIAAREEEMNRQRVDNAREAAITIASWYRDQNQWIGDNAAGLSEELQKEFAARAEAARAKAEETKEHDVGLAQEYLATEQWYQSERARIAGIEDEKARKAERAILEREYGDRLSDAEAHAALKKQLQEEEEQRWIDGMRKAGAAGGQALAGPLIKALADVDQKIADMQALVEATRPWRAMVREVQVVGATMRREITDSPFQEAIRGATDLEERLIAIGAAARAALLAFQEMQTAAGPTGIGGVSEHAEGGTVPGRMNAPRLIKAHGGEKITSTAGREGGSGVTVQVLGPVYATSAAEAEGVGSDMGRGIRMALRSQGIAI